jgi:hypothetical protein
MSGALDPIQDDLPLDNGAGAKPGTPADGAEPWKSAPAPPPPSLYEQTWTWLRRLPWEKWCAQAWAWLRRLPWAQWRAQARPLAQTGARQLEARARQAGGMLRVAVSRGMPYTVALARASAKSGVLRALPQTIARVIHIAGFPAVVIRCAVQVTVAYRAGLAIEQVVFFRVDDPAGYTVYEAPRRLPTALAVAFIPSAVLGLLAAVCLTPVVVPVPVLHLPVTWLTWLQVWLGLACAAHALPSYEEAGPLAEQLRLGVRRAEPAALLAFLPVQAVALVGRLGGTPLALAGGLAGWWLAALLASL